ncbi:hypothetical protein FGO68_gene8800 [Halteria grandinella]|uniref:Ubiquitin-like domain-containing protein n=1 Tax=Halteria grandinella TaxID=5974 RepID=A0A8J8SZV7_HALGN|nr:hypothetical protein FGO68_gene8800 [Halteria grandinella]
MQLFVKTLTGATLTCDVEGTTQVAELKQQVAEKTGVSAEEIVLIQGLSVVEKEATINMVIRLCGGKKKRKKKIYTKPKRIAHKHKKRPKAILEYFNVDNTGKITKLKIECEKCPAGTYMADHPDRHTCGKCGNMFYKLTKDGKRLPIPKQNKPAAVVKEVAVAAKGGAKGKKK